MNLPDLEQWYKQASLPAEIRLNHSHYINDVEKFVYTHLSILKANSGNKRYRPYYNRLMELKAVLEVRNK